MPSADNPRGIGSNEKKRFRAVGNALLCIAAFYFVGTSLFLKEEIRLMDYDAGENAFFLPMAVGLIGLVVAFVPLAGALGILFCSRREGKWRGCLVWGLLLTAASLAILVDELGDPTVLTILPAAQILLGGWTVHTAWALRQKSRDVWSLHR